VSFKPRILQLRLKGTGLLAAFLILTLAFSLWLAYQTLDAARSHRRTAEGVLGDFAGIAVWEYSRRIQENLGSFGQAVFDDIPRNLRRQAPGPDIMENDLRYALHRQDCECRRLRREAWFFRVDLRDSTTLASPDTLDPATAAFLASTISRDRASHPDSRESLIPVPAGSPLGDASLLLYRVTGWSDEDRPLAYGVVATTSAMEELFANWYYQDPVLPSSLAEGQPNDSLLEMTVLGAPGAEVFTTSIAYDNAFFASDTLEQELGSLVIRGGIRADAAETLIIGGLPRSRLPLLLVLLALTLGVGTAALLQIRREHHLARLRNDFISSVSHEFRTPLTQIRLFSEILDSGKLSNEEERRRSTAVINREAGRLTHLVENILQFSQLQQARAPSRDVEPTELGPILAEVIDAFLPQARSRGIRILTSNGEGIQVMGRRGGIHRILSNLLDNALKYGPDGQQVRIRVSEKPGDRVWLSVEDEGPGIAPRDRQGIWDPYRRLERDVEGKVQGSGIGLSVVAELAQVFGGRAWVEGEDGKGARFVIEFRKGESHQTSSEEERGD